MEAVLGDCMSLGTSRSLKPRARGGPPMDCANHGRAVQNRENERPVPHGHACTS
jgi:hypothetical protein